MPGWSRSRRLEAYNTEIKKRGGNAAFFNLTQPAGWSRISLGCIRATRYSGAYHKP
jgi:hypothetical protein